MKLLRIKPSYTGMNLSIKVFPANITITLDATREYTQQELANYRNFIEFHEFIEEYESTAIRAYQGVEHPVFIPELSDSETLCSLCGTSPCQCEEVKPAKSTKKRK